MENNRNNLLEGLNQSFITAIHDLLSDPVKYNELAKMLKQSNLTLQSKTSNNQLTLTSENDLTTLKSALDELLQTA